MFAKTKIALATALLVGAASAALASDHEDQHWDSQKEMARQEQVQRAHPTTNIFGGIAYGFVSPAHKSAKTGY
jgi:hypothetical protein